MTRLGCRNEETRSQWLENALRRIPDGHRILDAGAGELRYKKFCTHLDYVAQDFGKYTGTGNGRGLQTGTWDQSGLDIVCDIVDIPEPDASFDALLCVEVLEHLPEPLKALREFSRLLRAGGTLILTAPFCSLTHFAPYHFYSGFNRYFYEHHLAALGFEIVELTANGNYFEYLGQEMRRAPDVVERLGGAPIGRWGKRKLRRAIKVLERHCEGIHNAEQLLCFGFMIRARRGNDR
jgi:SAM-dependent methyltransferase